MTFDQQVVLFTGIGVVIGTLGGTLAGIWAVRYLSKPHTITCMVCGEKTLLEGPINAVSWQAINFDRHHNRTCGSDRV